MPLKSSHLGQPFNYEMLKMMNSVRRLVVKHYNFFFVVFLPLLSKIMLFLSKTHSFSQNTSFHINETTLFWHLGLI